MNISSIRFWRSLITMTKQWRGNWLPSWLMTTGVAVIRWRRTPPQMCVRRWIMAEVGHDCGWNRCTWLCTLSVWASSCFVLTSQLVGWGPAVWWKCRIYVLIQLGSGHPPRPGSWIGFLLLHHWREPQIQLDQAVCPGGGHRRVIGPGIESHGIL